MAKKTNSCFLSERIYVNILGSQGRFFRTACKENAETNYNTKGVHNRLC